MSLVLSLAPLVRLGLVVDVSLRELAEREHVPRGLLLPDGVATLRDFELGLARKLACVGKRHGRVPTEREPLLPSVLIPIEERPRPDASERDAERQTGSGVVEVVGAPDGRLARLFSEVAPRMRAFDLRGEIADPLGAESGMSGLPCTMILLP